MINKKCRKCKEKISKNYNFCPYCSEKLKGFEKKQDWGILGKDDFIQENQINFPTGFNSILNNLLKTLGKQLTSFEKEYDNLEKKSTPKNFGIKIYTSKNNFPEIKISSMDENINKKQEKDKKRNIELPKLDPKKYMNLEKKEPETKIKRFSDKIIYEVVLPGVNSIKDISIISYEDSIEIKAISNKQLFQKIIPLGMEIKKYNLLKEKLILEFDP